MKKLVFIFCLLILTGCASYQKQHTATYNLSKIRTFAFDNPRCGIVGSPKDEKSQMIAYIREEMHNQLKEVGLIPVGVHPDVYLRFGLILKSNGKDFDPAKAQTEIKEEPKYVSTFDYKPGSLIIDAVEPFYGSPIWRVAIDTKITANMSPEEKKKKISGYIRTLLKNFPPPAPAEFNKPS